MLNIIFYVVVGFFGFVILLVLLTILFGKRAEKKWDLEADFLDPSGKEIGELDIELKRYPEEQTDFQLNVKFSLRHDALRIGRRLEVMLRDETILRGQVKKASQIRLGNEHLVTDIKAPLVGDRCKVFCEGHEICRSELRKD